jgi:hypothetical protein
VLRLIAYARSASNLIMALFNDCVRESVGYLIGSGSRESNVSTQNGKVPSVYKDLKHSCLINSKKRKKNGDHLSPECVMHSICKVRVILLYRKNVLIFVTSNLVV